MSQPKVSVIIPVYNTAPYLREAIGSIMHQTLTDIEILVVNDGSTDGSGEIIRELAEQDRRIKVFEQANKGLSEARNTGLRHVTGKYLYFMDSDDYLEPDCFDCCYTRCESQKLDFVFFDAENRVDTDVVTNLQNYVRKGMLDDNKVYDGIEVMQTLLDKYIFKVSVWLIFARVDFVYSYFKGFFPGIYHEDHLYTVPLHLFAKRVGYIPIVFFKRRIRSGSIMNKCFTMRNMKGYMVTTLELLDFAKLHYSYSDLINRYLKWMLNAVIWQAHQLPLSDKIKTTKWFIANGLLCYVSFRNVVVFWLKKTDNLV